MIRKKHILLFFRLVVGGVFIWAGILKIADPLEFAQSIKNYRVFSHEVSFFLALVLPWLEVVCGAFLVLGLFRKSTAFILSAFLIGFLVLVSVTIVRGIETDCGCFGVISPGVGFKLLIMDAILLAFSLTIFFQSGWTKHPRSSRRYF